MLLKLPHRQHPEGWHNWFAWYPVKVKLDLDGACAIVWLQNVERRWKKRSEGIDACGNWEYLLPKGWNA